MTPRNWIVNVVCELAISVLQFKSVNSGIGENICGHRPFFNYKDLFQALGIFIPGQRPEVWSSPQVSSENCCPNYDVGKVVFIEEAKLLNKIRSRMVFGDKMVDQNMPAFFP